MTLPLHSSTATPPARDDAGSAFGPARRPSPIALFGLLAVGAWLLVGWLVLGYVDQAYAAGSNVVIGLGLVSVALLQVRDRRPADVLRTLPGWLGVALIIAPVVFRFGDGGGRSLAAYVNTIACGLLVLGLGAWRARRTA